MESPINPEASLVYCALLNQKLIPLQDVRQSEFECPILGAAWAAQQELWAEGRSVNHASLVERLGAEHWQAVKERMQSIKADTLDSHIHDYAKLVKQGHKRREIVRVTSEILSEARKGVATPSSMLARGMDAFYSLHASDRSKGLSGRDLFEMTNEDIERRDKDPDSFHKGVPTGFPSLDCILPSGGLPRGGLSIVGGSTSQGKSSLLNSIAENAYSSGKSVDYYSFEDSSKAIFLRQVCRKTGLNNREVQSCIVRQSDRKEYYRAGESIANSKLMVYQDPRRIEMLTLSMIQNALQNRTDLIVVDYIQKISTEQTRLSMNDQLGHISQCLFDVASRTDCAVLTASQLRRVRGLRPRLDDLRNSGNLEQDAHCVFLIWRKENSSNIAEINLAKNKNGPTGRQGVMFVEHSSTFTGLQSSQIQQYETMYNGEDDE